MIIRIIERAFLSLFISGSFFIAGESCGAESSSRASLSVTAKTDSNRERTKTTDEKANATIETLLDTETEICKLDMEVENSSDHSDNYQLEWFFISKRTSVKGMDELVVFDSGKLPVTLQGGASAVKTAESKPFIFSVKNTESVSKSTGGGAGTGSSRQTRSGDAYAGYIVWVKAGGEILDTQSNSSRFLKDEWFKKCAAFTPAKAPAAKKKK